MLFPLLAAVTESIGAVTDKFALNIDKITGKKFSAILLLFMGIVALPLLFFFQTKPGAFDVLPLTILFLIILGSSAQNLLYYMGLTKKNLSAIEPIRNAEPIIVILVAFLFFPTERNIIVLMLGIVTTAAIIYSHLEKDEIKNFKNNFDKYAIFVLLSMITSGFLNSGYKYVLEYYSPISLFTIRAIGVGTLLYLIYKPNITEIKKKQRNFIAFSAILYACAAMARYSAIATVGIGITVIILTLSPVLIYGLSKIVLKEKLTKNQIIASIVIVGCVIGATMLI